MGVNMMEVRLSRLEDILTQECKDNIIQQIFCVKKNGELEFLRLGNQKINIPNQIIEILNDYDFEIALIDKILKRTYLVHMKVESLDIEKVKERLFTNDQIIHVNIDIKNKTIVFEFEERG